jgi:hypothetical protein
MSTYLKTTFLGYCLFFSFSTRNQCILCRTYTLLWLAKTLYTQAGFEPGSSDPESENSFLFKFWLGWVGLKHLTSLAYLLGRCSQSSVSSSSFRGFSTFKEIIRTFCPTEKCVAHLYFQFFKQGPILQNCCKIYCGWRTGANPTTSSEFSTRYICMYNASVVVPRLQRFFK